MSEARSNASLVHFTRRPRVWLGAALGYWLVWLTMTHWPKLELPPLANFRIDRIIHFAGYSVLAFLLALNFRQCTSSAGGSRLGSVLAILFLIAAAGIADELTQPYFGRSFEWGDYVADLSGGLTGALVATWFLRSRPADSNLLL